MAMNHLTDEQIQKFLDGRTTGDASVQCHLRECESCQHQVETYSTLYAELGKPAPPDLSATFADSVMARISTQPSESKAFQIWQILIPLLGFVSGLGVTFYLIGFKSLTELINKVGALPEFAGSIIASIAALFSGIELNYGLLGLGIFSLILLSGLDYFLFRSKSRIGHISKMML